MIKTQKEIAIMSEGGRRLGAVLSSLKEMVRPGITTNDLDRKAKTLIEAGGDKPAFLGYRPHGARSSYPATLCASVNQSVVHGLPSSLKLKEGDVLKLDLGLIHEGLYVDAAITVGVGKINSIAKKLIRTTEEALEAAIEEAYAGNSVGDIGYAVQEHVKKGGFSVVKGLTGHGVGRALHEEPTIYNFGRRKQGMLLEVGMVIAIEPMVSTGDGRTKQLPDDSFTTADGSLAAHFEHTVAITKDGPSVLTSLP